MSRSLTRHAALLALITLATPFSARAEQTAPAIGAPKTTVPPQAALATAASIPAGYVIGSDDILSIVFWRDKDMSGDVVVRPDGKISVPVLNDVQAAGYTPEQLRVRLTEQAGQFFEDPNVTVVVRAIKSRNVYVTGNVAKPASYPIPDNMNVLQLIALAGGVLEYADSKHIVIIRNEGGRPQYHRFNYNEVVRQKKPQQNILLKPGDTVVVP